MLTEPGQQWIDFGDERINKLMRMSELIVYASMDAETLAKLRDALPGEIIRLADELPIMTVFPPIPTV